MDSTIDMAHRAIAQSTGHRIVFFASYIRVCLSQQLQSLVQASRTVIGGIDIRVIMNVLAVINGSSLDLSDRGINLGYRNVLLSTDRSVSRAVLQHPPRGPQVRQRVQIGRMFAWQI